MHRGPIAVDSNLLLLLVVGSWSPRFIASHKRLSDYAVQDFYLLRDFVMSFSFVVTTAHVLTEVSNLAGGATGIARVSIYNQLAQVIDTLNERIVSSATASQSSEFAIFGLTDAALSTLCPGMPLLTEDGRLAAHLQRKGLAAITLESVRGYRTQANNAR